MRRGGIPFFIVLALCSATHADLDADLQKGCASAICVLADSGLPIREYNAEEIRPPASMVKLMQMLMVAEGLEEGLWTLDKEIAVSEHAERMGGSQVYLAKGETWTLGDLLAAVCVASANDAAMAIAEGLWGSKEEYLKAMNARAEELGMTSSEFHSVHGLPPDPGEKPDETCARDMAILGRHCVQQPLIMEWVGQKELTFREGEAVHYNTNKLLWHMEECDGLKTGYTRAAGWCLTSTAERDGIRVVAVVMGCESARGRFALAQAVLEEGFRECERVRLVAKGAPVEPAIAVQNCETTATCLAACDDVWVTIPKARKSELKLMTETPAVLRPPVDTGERLGELRVALGEHVLAKTALTVPDPLRPAPVRWKLIRAVLKQ